MHTKLRIHIAGSKYTINTDEDELYVHKLTDEINDDLNALMANNPALSVNDALVLCILNFADQYHKAEQASDNMRAQLSDYLEDAARARIEVDEAKREIERLSRELEARQ